MKDHKDYDSDYMYISDEGKFVCGCCHCDEADKNNIKNGYYGEIEKVV